MYIHFIFVCKIFTFKPFSSQFLCPSMYCSKQLWFCVLMLNHYMFFSSWMWLKSSSGNPNSDTRSMQRWIRSLKLSLELEEQSVDPAQGCCGWWEASMSIFSAPLQQSVSLHPPSPLQSEPSCVTSRSSMLSETSLTLGVGFSKDLLMFSMMASSCWETFCRRSVTEAGTGLSGCWIWNQHHTALWRDTQRGDSVRYNGTERQLGQNRACNNDHNKEAHDVSVWQRGRNITHRGVFQTVHENWDTEQRK